jgi:hypothetical protein
MGSLSRCDRCGFNPNLRCATAVIQEDKPTGSLLFLGSTTKVNKLSIAVSQWGSVLIADASLAYNVRVDD